MEHEVEEENGRDGGSPVAGDVVHDDFGRHYILRQHIGGSVWSVQIMLPESMTDKGWLGPAGFVDVDKL